MKRKKRPNLFTLLMLIVLGAAVAANALWALNTFAFEAAPVKSSSASAAVLSPQQQAAAEGRKEQKARQKEKANRINWRAGGQNTGDLSRVVVDSSDVLDVLQSLQAELGIDAYNEYYVSKTASNRDFETYTLQQKYEGMDVYGFQLKMTTDSYGSLLSVSGTHLPIYELPEENYGSSDCENLARRYLKQAYGYNEEDYRLNSVGRMIVPYDPEHPSICYAFDVCDVSGRIAVRRIFIDASTGQPGSDNDLVRTEMIPVTVSGQTQQQSLSVWRSSESQYTLRDDDSDIHISLPDSSDIHDWNETEEITWNPQEELPNRSGVDALSCLQKIYAYYQSAFEREGITGSNDRLDVVVDISTVLGSYLVDNAAMFDPGHMVVGLRSDSSIATFAAALDIMGHEAFHGVTMQDSSLYDGTYAYDAYTSQQYAIGEGLADIFGELGEDFNDDYTYNASCSWENACRNIWSPNDSFNANDFQEGTTESHAGAAVVSYPVWLMASGSVIGTDKAIDTLTLGTLYYYAMQQLTGQSGYADLRRLLEDVALQMNAGSLFYYLNDSQLEGVIDAMDAVGIGRDYDYSLTPGAVLEVYNADNQIDSSYHISITKHHGAEVVSQDVRKENAYLDLDKGIYDVVLTDAETDLTFSFSFAMNDNAEAQLTDPYEDTCRVYTSFEAPRNNVALVLDTSGSMDGTPIAETRKAALNFIDTIFEQTPNVNISVVTYAESSSLLVRSSDQQELKNMLQTISSGGGTNMYDGMQDGFSELETASGGKNIMVVMSDGLPNEGTTSADGSHSDAVIQLADRIKAEDVTIFSLGFFHNSYGSELTDGIALMKAIASEGYQYNVQDADNIGFIFNEIGQQIGGVRFVHIRIECPVAVTVTQNGETLSSDPENRSTSASFGSMTFEGEDDSDNAKILRLDAESVYEVLLQGTGTGTMDITVSYPDSNSVYNDTRTFPDIPVTPRTKASLSTAQNGTVSLDVDTDGDGTFDASYEAGANQTAVPRRNHLALFHLIGFLAVLGLFVFLWFRRFLAFQKAGRRCARCGAPLPKGSRFCEHCGAPAAGGRSYGAYLRGFFRKKSRWLPQLILIGALLAFTFLHGTLYAASRRVTDNLNQGRYAAAQMVYDGSIRGNALKEFYTGLALRHYRAGVENAMQNSSASYDAEALLQTIDIMLNE